MWEATAEMGQRKLCLKGCVSFQQCFHITGLRRMRKPLLYKMYIWDPLQANLLKPYRKKDLGIYLFKQVLQSRSEREPQFYDSEIRGQAARAHSVGSCREAWMPMFRGSSESEVGRKQLVSLGNRDAPDMIVILLVKTTWVALVEVPGLPNRNLTLSYALCLFFFLKQYFCTATLKSRWWWWEGRGGIFLNELDSGSSSQRRKLECIYLEALKGSESSQMESNECLISLADSTKQQRLYSVGEPQGAASLHADASKLLGAITNAFCQRNFATLQSPAFKYDHIKIILTNESNSQLQSFRRPKSSKVIRDLAKPAIFQMAVMQALLKHYIHMHAPLSFSPFLVLCLPLKNSGRNNLFWC